MKTILFVCTGNVFRSMSAELLLKKHLQEKGIKLKVASAGITAKKQSIHSIVKEELEKLDVDHSKHKQRKVTKRILASSDLIVSMARVHQDYLKEKYNKDSVIFNEIAFGKKSSFLDYPDIYKKTKSKKKAEEYLCVAINRINKAVPKIIQNIDKYIPNSD